MSEPSEFKRGIRWAIGALRDDTRYQLWHQQAGVATDESGEWVDWDDRRRCADYLESLAGSASLLPAPPTVGSNDTGGTDG